MKTAITLGLAIFGALFLAAPPLAAQTRPRVEIRMHAGVNAPVSSARLKSETASVSPRRIVNQKAWGTEVTSITAGFALHFYDGDTGEPITLDWFKINDFTFTWYKITPEKTDVLAYYYEQALAYFYQETATKGGLFTTKTREDTVSNSPVSTTPYKNLKVNEVGGLYFNGFGATLATPAPGKYFSNQLKSEHGYAAGFMLKYAMQYKGAQFVETLTEDDLKIEFMVTDKGPELLAMQTRGNDGRPVVHSNPDPAPPLPSEAVIRYQFPQIRYYILQTATDPAGPWTTVPQSPETFRFISEDIGEWKIDGLPPSPIRFFRIAQELEPYDPPAQRG